MYLAQPKLKASSGKKIEKRERVKKVDTWVPNLLPRYLIIQERRSESRYAVQ